MDKDLNARGREFSKVEYNDSTEIELPIDMRFNEGHVITIITYGILMILSAVGNITVLILIRRKKRISKSRIHTMLMHLALADLFVSIYTIFFQIYEIHVKCNYR